MIWLFVFVIDIDIDFYFEIDFDEKNNFVLSDWNVVKFLNKNIFNNSDVIT